MRRWPWTDGPWWGVPLHTLGPACRPGETFDTLVAFGTIFVTRKPQTVRSKGAEIAVAKDVAIPCPVECNGLRDDAGTTPRTVGELLILGWADRFASQRPRR